MTTWERKRLEKRIGALIPKLRIITQAWGCTPDVSDDLVQEAVTIALDKLEQLRNPDALEVWVIRIVTNCHRLYYRNNRSLTELEETQLVEETTPANKLETERTLDQVRAAIGQLNDEHRKVLTLVDMEGMDYKTVAEALDIRIGTVMSRLHRARGKLRCLLEDVIQQVPVETQHKSSVLWRVK